MRLTINYCEYPVCLVHDEYNLQMYKYVCNSNCMNDYANEINRATAEQCMRTVLTDATYLRVFIYWQKTVNLKTILFKANWMT